jgi:diaminohydroxyphosphoribosylaminopyrimidine deaminase/5-amino-6-(5-phosphoribosylamino)uracil reductase
LFFGFVQKILHPFIEYLEQAQECYILPMENSQSPMNHSYYMRLALEEAQSVLGLTNPNPAVGAIVVKNGQIIGRGATQPAGGPHAEVMALREAGKEAEGATIYVTLEPCCHYGKTPPCTLAIQQAGIRTVVGGMQDPNPLVEGGGFAALQKQGIEVIFPDDDSLMNEIEEHYRGFSHYIMHKRPWVEVKLAQSADGFIAGPHKEQVSITGSEAKKWTFYKRAQVDAVLIGAGTLREDDPLLNVREVPGVQPLAVVLGNRSEISSSYRLFQERAEALLVASRNKANKDKWPEKTQHLALESDDFKENWEQLMQNLYERGVHRVLVEAGAELWGLLAEAGLWDRFYLFTAGCFLEKGYSWAEKMAPKWSKSLKLSKFELVGADCLFTYHPNQKEN